ncbi:MAG: M48 family metalloprotease [Deinococcales bacterium]
MMRWHILFLLWSMALSCVAYSQEYWGQLTDLVGYDGIPIGIEIYTFESDREAEETMRWILDYVGIPANFIIKAANVPNAAAYTHNGQRYIVYNQVWIKQIKDTNTNDWEAISILAHEIGHHLSGHTLILGKSRPPLELEADIFSGFVLAQMGATLEEAQSAIARLTDETSSETHPPRSARLAAIANGWLKACEKLSACSTNNNLAVTSQTEPSPTMVSQPVISQPIASEPVIEQPIQSTNSSASARPIVSNRDWTPYVQEFNGTRMVLVPLGGFNMGTNEAQLNEVLASCGVIVKNHGTIMKCHSIDKK